MIKLTSSNANNVSFPSCNELLYNWQNENLLPIPVDAEGGNFASTLTLCTYLCNPNSTNSSTGNE